jgi:hypothetical protein
MRPSAEEMIDKQERQRRRRAALRSSREMLAYEASIESQEAAAEAPDDPR